ncbi:MAG: haloacid dehalogenase-like hydrolase [Candidatus Eiseniibacteriota bacterium]|jgi:phosphoglycolate phosphatase-like HAD superfamily hydrolase
MDTADPHRLVLFDIDGTLLTAGGLGGRAMLAAIKGVSGHTVDVDGYSYGGRTDPQIIRELLERAGLPAAEIAGLRPRILARYVDELERLLRGSRRPRLFAGVRELLARLEREPSVVVGLLTGNVEAAACLKLDHFGIRHCFHAGAFGSDDEDRGALVGIALERAHAATGVRFAPQQVCLVGDTPRDVDCARRGGTRVVAVATGPFGLEELARSAPDQLFSTLEPTERVVAALLDGC